MKTILSLAKRSYLKKVGISLTVIGLLLVMGSCDGATPTKYNLTIVASPVTGGTAADETGTSPYAAGTAVSIEAVAAAGYQFVNWSAPAGAFADASEASTTFAMPAQDVIVTANFAPFAGGDGTGGDPYQIADWHHLNLVRNYMDSHFILVNDLDSATPGYLEQASPLANDGNGWQPIGGIEVIDPYAGEFLPVDPFTGNFDGQGHEIRELFIDRSDEDGVGLFGCTGGVIEDVELAEGHVTGYRGIGILAGGNFGTLMSCNSTGSVSGFLGVGGLIGGNGGSASDSCSTASVSGSVDGAGVGGLAGFNVGDISACYAAGNVTGDYSVGGLIGVNTEWEYFSGTVDGSYASGGVSGDTHVGGLVGYSEAEVSDCYATGNVTGAMNVGGLVGYKYSGTVSNSFWDTQTSGQGSSAGGTGKTTAEMKDIVTFSGAGWDIIAVADSDTRNTDYVWNIVDDETYPFLSWQPV